MCLRAWPEYLCRVCIANLKTDLSVRVLALVPDDWPVHVKHTEVVCFWKRGGSRGAVGHD